MSFERFLVFGSVISWILLTYCSRFWIESVEGYLVGNRRRVIAVFRIECILTLLNVFAYGQLMRWFDDDIVKEKSLDRRKMQTIRKRCSDGLIIFLVLGQAIYFMYYAPAFLQWLLFDLTSICAGIWTNMIAFVCGFGIVNFYAGKMKMFHYTASILEIIGKVPYFNDLMWKRRSQIKFTMIITLLLSVSMFISRDWIVVKEKTIKIKNFTADGNRLKLAVISDLHAGASVYSEQINQVVEKVLENPVDAILIVGDMVDAPVAEIEDRVRPILQLPAHAPTYFVTGNHEYYYGDVQEWIRFYKNGRINVLENESTMLKGVCLAGVNDISSPKSGILNTKMDLPKAIHRCPSNTSQIVMAHNPASIREFIVDHPKELSEIDIVLSGHTHAGQFYVVIPVVYWLLPYFYGLYEIPFGGQLMVMAGSLYQGPPMKMIGMSEVWVLELLGE
ncbi:Calcineurin-like phosphoesterase domain-containing protein [Caenorhabditis elegans]|uniref:Calcineurin-like phosphoesterase domain-containing protein n=1 Tax=Caenorhabditis elegans TaxID=6239 RepID=Q22704_CAEEL|nr:Calcineurin-like phosphoesterase domain-containing protein [Caenorhabditis elegans]CAA92700.2 Calcineurin-like phosphoesterase domain-containing protein [Caenorhabditis elegans]|eukprot:NP_001022356.1 Uncharacterized protein CELE_T23G7.2 [Caenorhabditis elegans]